jgi:hypothetical protein
MREQTALLKFDAVRVIRRVTTHLLQAPKSGAVLHPDRVTALAGVAQESNIF